MIGAEINIRKMEGVMINAVEFYDIAENRVYFHLRPGSRTVFT